MKKLLSLLIPAVALIAVAMLIWNRLAEPEQDQATPATDVPVHVGKIIRTTLRGYVTAYGTVEPEPPGERAAAGVRLSPTVPGVVVAVHATEGQSVARGDVLFELDSRATDVAVAFATKTLEREKQLIQAGGASVKSLQQAQQQLDDALVRQAFTRVASPLAGTVTRVHVKPGEAVDSATALAEIVDLDRIVINASVPVDDLVSVGLGHTTEVLPGNDADPIPGTVTYIGTDVDRATGTVPLRASLPAGSGLRPGQFVVLRILTTEHKDCLAVPAESVVKDDDGATIIAVVSNNTTSRKRVTTGLHDRGFIEIDAAGIEPGMLVVTQGAYALPEETRVRVVVD